MSKDKIKRSSQDDLWNVVMPDEGVKAELDLGEPPQEYMEWALKELGELPDLRVQKLDEFRNMIYERGDCDPHRTDDAFLLRFLRARYFVLEKAYKLFVNYYNFKEDNPEFFEDVHLEHLCRVHNVISVPPYREQTGRRILLYRMGNWDPSTVSVEELFQATLVVLELAILEQRAQILGGVAMFDLGGMTLRQTLQMTPSVASKMVQIMVTHFPMKIKAIHIVNQSWMFDMVYNIFKPFLDERMKKRIFFHGDDMESLHQHIDPKHLPKQYGGVHEEYDYMDWIRFFTTNNTIVKELRSLGYVVDEDTQKVYLNEVQEKEGTSQKICA